MKKLKLKVLILSIKEVTVENCNTVGYILTSTQCMQPNKRFSSRI